MSPTTRRVIISFAVISIVICLCLGALGVGGTGLYLFLSPRVVEGTIPAPIEESETAVPGDSSLPGSTGQEMDQIQQEVIQLRGLQPNGEVTRELLSPEQLRENVIDDFLSDYSEEEAQDDARELAVFGLVEPGYDLLELYLELFSEQVAGYYDDELGAMFVVQGAGFEGTERITYAHEYTHALQDQNYDFEETLGWTDEACEADSERCAAIQALIEGDASMTEMQWLVTHATQEDMEEIQEFYSTYESPVYDSAPPYLRYSFIFPYQAGQQFVEYLYDRGGWEAVNEAYRNPPVSTEQIIHPERYPADTPLPVTLPDLSSLLGADWREISRNTMGELGYQFILAYGVDESHQLEVDVAEQAAAGWGGDAYVVYYDATQDAAVMALQTIWESESEAQEFTDAFNQYASARFGQAQPLDDGGFAWEDERGFHLFRQLGETTLWIFAPDAELAETIWAEIQAQ